MLLGYGLASCEREYVTYYTDRNRMHSAEVDE